MYFHSKNVIVLHMIGYKNNYKHFMNLYITIYNITLDNMMKSVFNIDFLEWSIVLHLAYLSPTCFNNKMFFKCI